jgi:hypothetical protein
MGLFFLIFRILVDLFRMASSAAYVSHLALLRREMGLSTKLKQSIHDPLVIHSKEPSLKGSFLTQNVLVKRRNPLPSSNLQKILDLELKILQLQDDFKFLSLGELQDFVNLGGISELKQCFERVSHHRPWIRLSKKRIIDGIQLRAKEEFPDDPNYVENQTLKLDEIFIFQQEDLTYETNEILREIDRLEKI